MQMAKTNDKATNIFGGKQKRGLYVPLSPDELESIHRLIEMRDVCLIIHGWGIINSPRMVVGEHKVTVPFRLTFKAPDIPMPVYFFDLELKTIQTGITLFRKRMPCTYDNKPIIVQSGQYLDMAWDISIQSIDPRVVKLIKPGAFGLTSRRRDKDTGELSGTGNMKLTPEQRLAMMALKNGEKLVQAEDLAKAIKATQDSGQTVILTPGGFKAPEVV